MENCYKRTKCSKSIHFPTTNSFSTTQNIPFRLSCRFIRMFPFSFFFDAKCFSATALPRMVVHTLHPFDFKGNSWVCIRMRLQRVLREALFFVLLNQSSINLSHNSNVSPIDNYNQTHSRQLIKWQNTQIYFLISTHCCFQQDKDKF